MRARWIVGLGLAATTIALGACQRQVEVQSGPAASEEVATDTLEGTVRQVGSTPFVRTVVQGPDGSGRVVGPPAEELARLVGAEVRCAGAWVESDEPGRTFEVASYEIVSVDGDRPEVGWLRRNDDGGFALENDEGDRRSLQGVSERLADRVGARIWAVLGENGTVQRYGILREPGPDASDEDERTSTGGR
jgi:hypothetical protein